MTSENAEAGSPAGEAEGAAEQPTQFPEPTLLRHLFDMAQQAAIALGEIENPITNKREKNLPAARYIIDTIAMLEEKTRGNRSDEEESYITGVLSNLKMAFVNRSK